VQKYLSINHLYRDLRLMKHKESQTMKLDWWIPVGYCFNQF